MLLNSQDVTFDVSGGSIRVVSNSGFGETVSDGIKVLVEECSDRDYNAAVDGVEALLLAMACAGIDLDSEEMRAAVLTTMQGLGNYFD